MSFGGLLGSLYGDLPAPKSSSSANETTAVAIPEVSIPQDAPSDNSTSATIVEREEQPKPLGTKPSPGVEEGSLDWVKDRARLLLLQPAAARKREVNRRSYHSSAVPPAKRVKESSLVLSNEMVQQVPVAVVELSISDTKIENGLRHQLLPIPNEYDPSKPNSYDEFGKERTRLARKKEDDVRRQEELERMREEQRRAATAASVPSSLNVSGEEAWRRRGQITQAFFGVQDNSLSSAPTALSSEGISGGLTEKRGFAQKMLEKMGWKHGEGLGKEKQGILAPLVARKTDKRSGVIVHGAEKPQEFPKRSTQQTSLPVDASRIVLLTNLVGKGEVDADLESETAEEAAKYGNLLDVKVVEISALPDDQAVRIFCEYDSKDGAMRAINNFNGRLFGGRTVKAQFFSEVVDLKQ